MDGRAKKTEHNKIIFRWRSDAILKLRLSVQEVTSVGHLSC